VLELRKRVRRQVEGLYASGAIVLEYVGIECVDRLDLESKERLLKAVAAAEEEEVLERHFRTSNPIPDPAAKRRRLSQF